MARCPASGCSRCKKYPALAPSTLFVTMPLAIEDGGHYASFYDQGGRSNRRSKRANVILVLKIVAVLVVALLVVGTALRVRKLRRDDTRELSKPVERRLFSPPPSPYEPSKGFRLLDDAGDPVARPPVERPRLDPNRHYVFSESSSHTDEVVASHSRHGDDWFLTRSSHRSAFSIVMRRLAIIVLIGLIIAVIATYYVNHHSPKVPKGTSSDSTTSLTTTAASATSTKAAFPTSFTAASTSGDDANYSVPASSYQVVVSGTRGATWAVYNMGPNNTLEWQGIVAKGHVESLKMRGNSRITIGSPSNATVSIRSSPVIFPTHLPPTLVLVFSATTATTTTTTTTTTSLG